jgi:RNA polymerase sigma-70 factor (ECF subfamily)
MTDHDGVDKKEFNFQDFKKGAPDAFRNFFLQFYGDFFSFSLLLLRDNIPSKRLTAAAFFMLWAKHSDFDSERNIRAFLYTCIRDGSLQYLRHIQQHSGTEEFAPEVPFRGSLPEGMAEELLAFADHFASTE